MSLLEHQLNVAVRNKKQISIIYADMDNLKVLNDSLGHNYGDEAIVKLVTFFREVLRRSDIVARVGGDEFAIAMPDFDANAVEVTRKRLIERMDDYNKQKKPPYPIELSMGVVVVEPVEGQNIDKLLADADKLMYEDKKRRKAERLSAKP